MNHIDPRRGHFKWQQLYEELRAENAELKRDAELYRWVKPYFIEGYDADKTPTFQSCHICRNEGESLDDAIARHIKDDDING